jgi:RNA polymerase sigma factor (sigma-70 family)
MTSLAYIFFPSTPDDATPIETRVRHIVSAARANSAERCDTDALLADRIRTGDDVVAREALESLYRVHYDQLIGYAASVTESMATAEDVVADVFIMIWNRRANFRPTLSVRSYLYGAVRHRAANTARAIRRAAHRHRRLGESVAEAVVPSAMESPDAAVLNAEVKAKVDSILVRLTPYARSVLVFRARDGMDYDEIAAILGTSADAVRKQFFRAVAQVRGWAARPNGEQEQ